MAGHTEKHYDNCNDSLLIDTHSKPVCNEVWQLYAACIQRHGPINTLVEWDAEIPTLNELVAEAKKAADILASHWSSSHAAS